MITEEIIKSLEDKSFNMSDLFSRRNELSIDEWARLCSEIYYAAFVLIDHADRQTFHLDVAEELKEFWND